MDEKRETTAAAGEAAWTRAGAPADAALWDVLGAAPNAEPPPGFTARVMQDLAKHTEPRRGWRRAGWRWTAGAAAAALLIAAWAARPCSDTQEPSGAGVISASLEDVGTKLATLSDDDLVAFDIDGLQRVNEEWFGG
jgi:hypothetical protein